MFKRLLAACGLGGGKQAPSCPSLAINPAGLNLIKQFEGCKLKAYRCPANVPTIGYGSTGPHVRMGMEITAAEADALLRKDVARFEAGVRQAVAGVPTTSNQFSAMVALAFNIGLGAFQRSSVLRHHRAGAHERAAQSFGLWVKANGRELRGLVRRRQAEAELYRAA